MLTHTTSESPPPSPDKQRLPPRCLPLLGQDSLEPPLAKGRCYCTTWKAAASLAESNRCLPPDLYYTLIPVSLSYLRANCQEIRITFDPAA